MKTSSLLTMALLIQAGRLAAQHEPVEPNRSATRRVAFAQHCFWTGEMKLGQIEGVVRTEAGFFQGREVTLVHFASDRISLEELARKASQAGVADMLYLEPASGPQQTANLAVPLGKPLDQTYRASVDDARPSVLQLREVIAREENRVAIAAKIGRSAHTIEHERVFFLNRADVVDMTARVDALVRGAAALQLREERPEPFRMLEINPDRQSSLAHCLPTVIRACGSLPRARAGF